MSQATTSNHQVSHNDEILKIQLSGSQGEEHLKASFLAFVNEAIDKGIKKVMVHNHDLGHHISPHFQNWAQINLELPLLQNGVDKIAIVHPNKREFFNLIATRGASRRQYFDTEAEAMSWLNS
jgi:hypothetical protein